MKKFPSIEYVMSLTPEGMKEGRDNVRKLLKKLGNPQNTLQVFHVTGSNGKGSVCQMISQVLSKGFHKKVGLFTSPHLVEINERFQINGKLITNKMLEAYYKKTLSLAKKEQITLSFFEIQVVVMICYFVDQKVDYAVVEVGLGGTWDGTNIFSRPLACFITSITQEHTHVLGKTKASILKNKLGIVKSGSTLYSPIKNQTISNYCKKNGAKFAPLIRGDLAKREGGFLNKDALTNLPGPHQQRNAQMVLQALVDQGFDKKIIQKTLFNICNPGRFDWIAPNILVDTANNEENIGILAEMLEEGTKYKVQSTKGLSLNSPLKIHQNFRGGWGCGFTRKNLVIIFGTTQVEPQYAGKLSQLIPAKERWYIDKFCDRALPGQTYVNTTEKSHILNWKHDTKIIQKLLQDKTKIILIYGSLYLIGEIMRLSRYKPFATR